MDIYLFNWTNPQDILNKTIKPNFVQLGPYRFREFPDKVNLTINDNNATISYRKISTYFFEANGSNGSLNDTLNIVNMVALGAGVKAKNWSFFKKMGLSMTLNTYGQKIYVTKTVGELLFDGYEDEMVTMSRNLPIFGEEAHVDRVGFFYKVDLAFLLSVSFCYQYFF